MLTARRSLRGGAQLARLGRTSLRATVVPLVSSASANAIASQITKRHASFPGGQFPGMKFPGQPQVAEKGATLKQYVSTSLPRLVALLFQGCINVITSR